MSLEAWDAILVGSGAGGGPLSLSLAEAGLRVLVLEKGPRIAREDYRPDEIEVAHNGLFWPTLEEDPHTVVTRRTTEPTRTQLGWIASCVGGGTVHMGSFLYRFLPDDFRMRSRFGPYAELADWPYPYEELEPYYLRAEREVGVAGEAGVSPFEGPRSGPYPLPPLDSHPLAESLHQICHDRGLHPFPTPRGINSRPYGGRPACAYCQVCTGYGCRVGAKGSSQEALLPRAEATGRCEIRAGCMVRRITLGRDGRARGCLYTDPEGREIEVRARIVCICCSAVESARLLLLSSGPLFPDGIGNDYGLVGRHLQFHGVTMGEGLLPMGLDPSLAGYPNNFLGTSVLDHYLLPEGVSDLPKGGVLRFDLSEPTPVGAAQLLASEGEDLLWGMDLKLALRRRYREHRAIHLEVFHDFLPNRHTRVTLDPEIVDRWGLPVARIHLDLPSHHRVAGQWLLDRGLEVLDSLGAVDVRATTLGGTSSYLVHGTCRAGHNPRSSVIDSDCRVHGVPNLYVVDGSFMPTSGGAAPTLTILANSFRTADRILERGRRGELPEPG